MLSRYVILLCIVGVLCQSPLSAQESGHAHEHPQMGVPTLTEAILSGYDSPRIVAELEARLKMLSVGLSLSNYEELETPSRGILEILENVSARPIAVSDKKLAGIVSEMRISTKDFAFAVKERRLSQLTLAFAQMQASFKLLRARLL